MSFQWLPLQEIKHGDIHLQLQWMHLTESIKTLDEVRCDENVLDPLEGHIQRRDRQLIFLHAVPE